MSAVASVENVSELPLPLSLASDQIRLDESLYEVVAGEIVEKPAMGAFQTRIATRLLAFLFNYVEEAGLGRASSEMLHVFDRARGLKRRPDVSFVSYSRWDRTTPVPNEEAWDVVPELAVEVVSPSNMAEEMLTKIGEYFRAGCLRVWVVYPNEQQVYVYSSPTSNRILTIADELDGETAVPGFKLPVAKLFDDAARG